MLYPQSISFDHTSVGHPVLGGPKQTRVIDFTIEMATSASAQALLKPKATIQKIDMVLYVKDSAGRQHFRSQVEIGNAEVVEYKLSTDKKSATVKLSATNVYVQEPSVSTDKDWVTSS